MDLNLKEKIEAHINTIYQDKLKDLEQLKNNYREIKESLEAKIIKLNNDDELSKHTELKALVSQLETALKSNANLISNKIKEPSQPVNLNNTLETIKKIDEIINAANNDLIAFNQKIDNKKQEIETIKVKFWKLLRKRYNSDILTYQEQSQEVNNEIIKINIEIENIDKQIKHQNDLIAESQRKTKNIDVAVNNMNKRLKSFGMEGFSIEKVKGKEKNEPFL